MIDFPAPEMSCAKDNPPVTAAASWLAATPVRQRPVNLLAHLQRRFVLSPAQAVEAIREARLMQGRAN